MFEVHRRDVSATKPTSDGAKLHPIVAGEVRLGNVVAQAETRMVAVVKTPREIPHRFGSEVTRYRQIENDGSHGFASLFAT